MREIEEIVEDIAQIYRRSSEQAEEYLHKARKLKGYFGAALAVVYCWFYSVPQKWIQVEPKIFKLMKHTNSFDLDTTLIMSREDLAKTLKPMIFYNEISLQLKNFCKAIKNEYSSWDNFAKTLNQENVFTIFGNLRKHRNIRVTFKNLAAMKIFIGIDDDLLILDTHVAKVFGLDRYEVSKCRTRETFFENLLRNCEQITDKLRRLGFNKTYMAKWSLAIWFGKSKIHADDLLRFS